MEPSPLISLIVTWLPVIVVLTLFVVLARRSQKQVLDANREAIAALKANTAALDALRRQVEKQAKP